MLSLDACRVPRISFAGVPTRLGTPAKLIRETLHAKNFYYHTLQVTKYKISARGTFTLTTLNIDGCLGAQSGIKVEMEHYSDDECTCVVQPH